MKAVWFAEAVRRKMKKTSFNGRIISKKGCGVLSAVLAVAAPVLARTVDSACWASQSTWHVGPIGSRSGSGAESDVSYEPRVWMVAESVAGDLETKPITGLCIMFR